MNFVFVFVLRCFVISMIPMNGVDQDGGIAKFEIQVPICSPEEHDKCGLTDLRACLAAVGGFVAGAEAVEAGTGNKDADITACMVSAFCAKFKALQRRPQELNILMRKWGWDGEEVVLTLDSALALKHHLAQLDIHG